MGIFTRPKKKQETQKPEDNGHLIILADFYHGECDLKVNTQGNICYNGAVVMTATILKLMAENTSCKEEFICKVLETVYPEYFS